jgi:hypothetical protein
VTNASLTTALALWRRGLSIVPVPRPRPGVPPGQPGDGKVPAIPWRDYQQRLPTEDEIRRWFATPMNIAIITGKISDVVVVDADEPEALRWCTANLRYTPWQTQTSRGFHLFYRHPGPEIEVRNRARIETRDGRLAIDVRGDGGYVIAPGSIHASGAEYRHAGDWTEPRESLPRFWIGWLARPARPTAPQTRTPRPTGDVVERARRYLAAIPPPQIGGGSDAATLYAACRLVRGFELNETDATSLLWEWCGGRAGWTFEWVAQKVQHARRYGSEPIGALR